MKHSLRNVWNTQYLTELVSIKTVFITLGGLFGLELFKKYDLKEEMDFEDETRKNIEIVLETFKRLDIVTEINTGYLPIIYHIVGYWIEV